MYLLVSLLSTVLMIQQQFTALTAGYDIAPLQGASLAITSLSMAGTTDHREQTVDAALRGWLSMR